MEMNKPSPTPSLGEIAAYINATKPTDPPPPPQPEKKEGSAASGAAARAVPQTPEARYQKALFIDLTGNGIKKTNIDSGVTLNTDSNGKTEKIAWAVPGTGIIVQIVTDNAAGSSIDTKPISSFMELAEFDLNSDGYIDSSEAEAAGLCIWKDDNSNNVVDAGELKTFAETSVSSIYIRYTESPGTDTDAEGNIVIQKSTYKRTDGNTGDIENVWLLIR